MMTPPLMIRLDMESMRYQIMHAFSLRHEEIEAQLDAELKRLIENFDYDTYVRSEVEKVFNEAIKESFRHAVSQLMWSEPLRTMVKDISAARIEEAMRKAMEETRQ